MTDLEIIQVSPERYRVSGELDMASAETLHKALEPIAGARDYLVLDVQQLTFIDSSGIRALVQLSTGMDHGGGALVLSNVSASVQRLLDIVGLEALPGITVENDA